MNRNSAQCNVTQIAIPVHQEAGDGESRKSDTQQAPKDFEGKSPQRAKMQGMHGPDKPIAQGMILPVVPDGEGARGAGIDGHNVAMGKITRRPQIHFSVDDRRGERGITELKEAPLRRCLMR